ncbi:bifunctional salicylyl-CoA 5-hydroxylase/oxidoreductase [Bordetella hinzii]|uniref:bifunctional salicylyl-CoA 5-hydroxylase/oxidoreductase n=1 Tax=Bordetella hinzii TaxID=103855 RepID=UPI001C02F3F8|nr:bifunctional salicylyl-CoA 5-hydroxylase/oxidoreductase [Bordetella hinzii]QWF37209.1 bifunctional salicylyl-CoA 5-hydroxylase/oxidoreductase [Bordetella hinzii]QWF41753.1 bifunctional salicylyl-CoA 5-hydroxylase/oxidoreductase [Bordetella hinzii]QWF46294.1 bifunctional salicylyl-CoA 5-hydroxylase/oxidoreductase [Bordetella hinzii]QWF50833.1 bifunctional salicylyl-CoA 5-hydroxylase/oxidoreductase [Bordetella hinzii]QWF55370.1 bifunctional salicylyl-CoA 5-hydroxylase/oxidoreductase [Bordetel
MKIVCIGGGPAGLYFGLLMKLRNPDNDVTVVERNRPYDTFGWGVVFSDATMENLRQADPVSARTIGEAFNHWDDIDIHFKGRTVRSGGHGFIGIGRKRLLNILQARCEDVGVKLAFETFVQDDQEIARQYDADLVIASDGINSQVRGRYAATFRPDIDQRRCRFVWLGTRKVFDAFTFAFVQTEHGWFQAHAYRFEDGLSTFIVETPEETWQAAGIERMSQEEGIAYCEKLFAPWLDGHPLMSNAAHLRGSAIWIRFPRVICDTWVHWNTLETARGLRDVPVVLMGDAAHTAHFSIGSGTKLALEDAIELARCMDASPGNLPGALKQYEAVRSVEVLKIQNAARNSTEWFENVARYADLPPEQFAYSLLTRSQRISHENLRLRDPQWLQGYERWLAEQGGLPVRAGARPPLPMLTPYRARSVTLPNRIVVSPMAMYSCEDGVPGDFHLVHLGARAMGGAGLVMVEMTCPAPDARITPGCPGLWNEAQTRAFARIVDFVHANSPARIGIQLGHAGRKGSTQLGWQRIDHPLPAGNWPLVSASPLPYLPGVSQVPREMTRADMDRVRDEFAAAATRAAAAGFDWLELHCAHGYLLSSFISPITNQRGDDYGGSLENRLRYPLEVFRAVRQAWPEDKPMSVRISAHDWVEGGIDADAAVEIARRFKEAGADMIDCSSGQVSPDQKPVYGRMYQTPFADRVRNEAGIPTIAVGAIFEADHANGIIASGRADLCALARPHLADAAWTLRETARVGYRDIAWPDPYLAGKRQLETNFERAASMAQLDVK